MKRAAFGQFIKLDYSGNESLNTICSNLYFIGKDVKKIVFTSCNPNDGKSYIVMQIARNLARRGKRVAVVDLDLRKSCVIQKYKIETEGEWVGAAHYLAGYSALEDIVYETNLHNLFLVPIGRTVANPIKMLDSQQLPQMLDELAAAFDIVLIDAPPLGIVVDAALIARECDGAVFVVKYNVTTRPELQQAQKQMTNSGCPILGAVINMVTFSSLRDKMVYNKTYYSHYNDEYYQAKPGKSRKKGRWAR